jgi:aminoglycoside phosphotransferase (APT) family kinase protein
MPALEEHQKFEQILQKIEPQGKLLKIWQPEGGVSAQITALEFTQPGGQTKKLILRRHGEIDRRQNPNIAADEFKLLKAIQTEGLASPAPVYLDTSGKIFPTPYLIIEYTEGEKEFAPSNLADYLQQFTTHLVKIHSVNCSNAGLDFLPKLVIRFAEEYRMQPMNDDLSIEINHFRESLKSVWPSLQKNEPVLLHGDYWPGNIIWERERLVGVIDWEDAKIGDPLADVANSRLEILWAFGNQAMHTFTQLYQSMMDINFSNLPYWDLWAVLKPASQIGDWGLESNTEKRMRDSLKRFAHQAFMVISEGEKGE